MIPPDNIAVYNQISFPPMQTLESFLPLLQKEYGIYQRGCAMYYTDNCLYIYPAYDTNPNRSEPPVNIYKLPNRYYSGMFAYHTIQQDGSLHILSDTDSNSITTSGKGTENIGTIIITEDPNKKLDMLKNMTGAQGQFNYHDKLRVENKGVVGNTEGQRVFSYTDSTQNPFIMASKLASQDATIVVLGWKNPIPFIIKPGQKCIYHYVDNEGYKTQNGIIESIVYNFSLNGLSAEYYYNGFAIMQLRLTTDNTPSVIAPNAKSQGDFSFWTEIQKLAKV